MKNNVTSTSVKRIIVASDIKILIKITNFNILNWLLYNMHIPIKIIIFILLF